MLSLGAISKLESIATRVVPEEVAGFAPECHKSYTVLIRVSAVQAFLKFLERQS